MISHNLYLTNVLQIVHNLRNNHHLQQEQQQQATSTGNNYVNNHQISVKLSNLHLHKSS